jgi:cholesterol oxidase
MEREIPLYTLDGVSNAEKSAHPFSTADGLGLSLQRFRRDECDDVVVLIHGLTTSSDMFIMPEHNNLVSYLLDNGMSDVWCLDFRMSNRFSYNLYPNSFSMDDAALFDHAQAIEAVREIVGKEKRIHVIAHCVGSLSFVMALAAGTVRGISSCISNSIALTPYIPFWSRIKIALFPFFLERIMDVRYVSPGWSREPRMTRGKLISKLISLFHRECDEPACHMLSLLWGSGRPALYRHENLSPETHRRLPDLFGATGLNYHRHIAKMIRSGHRAVKMHRGDPRYAALPDDYFEAGKQLSTPVFFVTGDKNRVFVDSNVRCYERLRACGVKRHRMQVFRGYGHQDLFMGRHADRDIFPSLLDFIREYGAAGTA